MKRIIVFFFVLFCSACDECVSRFLGLDPKLPPATSTGMNTFGCYVNGDLRLPRVMFFGQVANVTYKKNNNSLKICLVLDHGEIILQDSAVKVGKDVNLQEALFDDSSNIRYRLSNDIERKGQLFLSRFDTVNNIISGLFSFKAKNEDGDSVVITEGRFDMNGDYFHSYPNTEENNIIIQQ